MTRHYRTLDALRGVAALAVLVLHICRLFDFHFKPLNANLSVDFFFMLSGFVIAHSYGERLKAHWPVLAFLRKRVIRLYPMVLVGSVLGALVLLARQLGFHDLGWVHIALAILPNMVLLPSPALLAFRPFGFLLNSPFWSLSAEAFVNIVYAMVATRLTQVRLWILVVLAAIAVILIGAIAGTMDVGFGWSDYWIGLVRAVFPFFCGVLIRSFGEAVRVPRLPSLLFVIGLGLFLLEPLPVPAAVQAVLVVTVFPLLLTFGARATTPRWLDSAWAWLGELSYPLYTVHYPIVTAFAQPAKALHLHGWRAMAAALLCAGVAIGVAIVALLFIDRPLRAWLDRRLPALGGGPLQPRAQGL